MPNFYKRKCLKVKCIFYCLKVYKNVGVKNLNQTKKSYTIFALSLTAGVLILINAVGVAVVARWAIGIMPILPGSSGNDPMLFYTLSALGFILALFVLFGAFMFRAKPLKKKFWGALIVTFSLSSVIMGGGFIIGFILGIIGGAKAFKLKS